MPLRYSYLVEIKQKEMEIKALLIACEQSPNDSFLLERVKKKEAELEWFKKRIQEDPERFTKPEII
jgi:hypothetical protein